ncbi:hypothetical protein HQ489_00450 [Candidatus Woesearchaeota archaeon]|nr:hypothetical protein [Candidatus Woesearchaeota archaeon]
MAYDKKSFLSEYKIPIGIASIIGAAVITASQLIPSGLEHNKYQGKVGEEVITYEVRSLRNIPFADKCELMVSQEKSYSDGQTYLEPIYSVVDDYCNNTVDTFNLQGEGSFNRKQLLYGNKAAALDELLADTKDKFTNPQHDIDKQHRKMMEVVPNKFLNDE